MKLRALCPDMTPKKNLCLGIFLSLVVVLALSAGKAGAASECYDHWNGDAWHGSGGWAMVLCLDSPTMASCEVRYHGGRKITDLREHIATDRDRVIWTNYDNLTATYHNLLLDVVCRGVDGFTYTFEVEHTAATNFWVWGACGEYGDHGGPACVNDQNENALQVVYEGKGSGTVNRTPAGINCTSSNSGSTCYHSPTSPVTLSANPATGSVFLGWSGGGCSGTRNCSVTVDQAKTVTANFGIVPLPPINHLLLKSTK
ncbi:MAG: InlB B-repeat-containing protein [Desulfobulbaceae bacterium]